MSKKKKTVESVEAMEIAPGEIADPDREILTDSVGESKIEPEATGADSDNEAEEESVAVVEDASVEQVTAENDEEEVPSEPEPAEDAADAGAAIESIGEDETAIESTEQAKAILEALLFASGEPVSARKLSHAIKGMKPKEIEALVRELGEDLKREGRGIQVLEVAGGFQLSTRSEFADWVMRLLGHKRRSPLSQAALETLAIIAYKQPVTRADVDAIRGVESSGVIRTLLDLDLIEVKGRKEVLGKPQIYGTTEGFLRVFGLRKLEDLPSIKELREKYNTSALRKTIPEIKQEDKTEEQSDVEAEASDEQTAGTSPENENEIAEDQEVDRNAIEEDAEELESEEDESSDAEFDEEDEDVLSEDNEEDEEGLIDEDDDEDFDESLDEDGEDSEESDDDPV